MSERIVYFGSEGRLAGVLSGENTRRDIGVLLFNAGIVHRIGPHRLNVKIARKFASHRIASLRFDLSGLGESAAAPPGLGYEAQSIADISAAVDCLVKDAEAEQIIAIGMCSGADNAYRAAVSDDRISGLVLLDPFSYPAPMAGTKAHLRRLLDINRWKRKLFGGEKMPAATGVEDAQAYANPTRPYPPLEEFGADLQRLTDRSVKIFIRYTSFVADDLTRRQQFFSVFKEFEFGDALDVEVDPGVDHTYTTINSQNELLEDITNWLTHRFETSGVGE